VHRAQIAPHVRAARHVSKMMRIETHQKHAMSFSLPKEYGYVLLAVSGISLHVLLTGRFVGFARSKGQ
jgi:hypothetical protein